MNLLSSFKPKKKSTPIIKPYSGFDKFQEILNIESQFNKALTHFTEDRERENNNWKLYSGLDYGQWPEELVGTLLNEGRNVSQYNIIRSKIDTLVGSYLKNYFDVDFIPTESEYTDLTAILKTLYYSDKEMMDWESSYFQFLVDFLVYGGTEEMVISDRYSSFGNIGFERILPGHIIFDPEWNTLSGWDIRKCWKIAYLNAKEMKEIYNTKADMIDDEIHRLLYNGEQYSSTDFDEANIPQKDLNTLYGSKRRVIEEHSIEVEEKNVEYAFAYNKRNNFKELIEIPDYDDEKKKEWIQLNNVSLSDGVIKDKKRVKVYKLKTVCPELIQGEYLENGEPLLQIGRVPFFHTSCARMNGKDSGIVDLLKDAQQTINKRESLIDHMIASSASGAAGVDPAIVGNDFSKMTEIQENWANPSYKFWTATGEIASGRRHVEELPRTQFPSDVVNELVRMYDVVDRLSKIPANQEGRSEGSEDRSGIIYARKAQQAEIGLTLMLKHLEFHWNQKGEAYMLAAKLLYSDVPREFKKSGTEEKININIDDGNGNKINDISLLPRHKVIVSMSPNGVTQREIDRAQNAELLSVMSEANPLSRATLVYNIMKTLPNNTEERMRLENNAKLEMQLAEEMIKTQILNQKATQIQITMQLQGAMSPPQPGQPQQGQLQEGQPAPEQPVQQEPPMEPQQPTQ